MFHQNILPAIQECQIIFYECYNLQNELDYLNA